MTTMANLIAQNCREVTIHTYKQLPEIHRKQMARVATLGFGPEYSTAEDLLYVCCEGAPETAIIDYPQTAMIYLWDVVAEENPERVLYNCWRYFDEYGSVLFADSTEDAEVGCSNFLFEAYDSHLPEKVALAADFQRAFFGE